MSEQNKVQKYKCSNCGTIIPSILNESTGSIEPQSHSCPKCSGNSIIFVLEEKSDDNRQILYG